LFLRVSFWSDTEVDANADGDVDVDVDGGSVGAYEG
jgi:hypothetical protein